MKKIIVPVVAVGALAGWWFWSGDNADQQQNGLPVVAMSAPKKQLLTEWDEYTGRFVATERVEIRSRVSGYLAEIRFQDGQNVAQGDTLFIIDQRPFKIALERAEADYDLASKELERTRGLRASGSVSQQEFDRRTQEFRRAKASLDEAKLNLEFSEVKSPVSGRVSRNRVDSGNLITGGDLNATLLTTVVAEDPIHFYFEASEQELLKYIRLDQEGKRQNSRKDSKEVWVKLQDEKEFTHKGRMDFVDNEVDRATGSIQGRAVFDNPNDILLPGLFGRLRIAGSGEYEALLIPEEAIATNQNQKIVFTLDKDNTVTPRPVVLGPLYDGTWRIVRSGLSEQDQIVWNGLARIRPGIKVTPQPLQQTQAEAPATTQTQEQAQ